MAATDNPLPRFVGLSFGAATLAADDYAVTDLAGYLRTLGRGGSASVSVIDTASDSVTATVPTGAGPQYVQITPGGKTAYVAEFDAGGVTPITVTTNAAGAFIPTGSGAYAVGFSPDAVTAWVVDTNVNNVVPVAVATGTPGAPVTAGNVPDGVTVID